MFHGTDISVNNIPKIIVDLKLSDGLTSEISDTIMAGCVYVVI